MSQKLRIYFTQKRSITALMAIALLFVLLLSQTHIVAAASLTTASVTPSDPRPSATGVTYDIQASGVTTSPIKCMRVEFDISADGTGGKPTGLDITSATFSGTSDYVPTPGSWAVSNNNTTGVSSITFASGETPASATARNVLLAGVTNGSVTTDDFYVIFNTYNNVDCTSSPVDSATMAFIYTAGQAVTLGVDGSFAFTIAGVAGNGALAVNGATITNGLTTTSGTIPFGTMTSAANKVAAQDLTVSTNSGNGYTVYTRYTAPPTSGSNTIAAHTGTNAAPTTFSAAGIESFGYTTEDATLTATADRFTSGGGNKWAGFTTTNAEVVYSAAAVSNQTTRVGFQAGVANTTEPGAYVTTVIYTAVPVY